MRTMKDSGFTLKLLVGLSLLLVIALTGCSQKSQVDATASEADAVTVTASPSSISTSVTTIIEATVWADGSTFAGEEVTFTVSPSSAGTVSPSVVTSDGSGVAATVFTPTSSGQITINASIAGGVTGHANIQVDEAESNVGNAFVWVTCDPDTLRTGELGATNVRIEVRDSLQGIPPLNTEVVVTIGENYTDANGDGYYTPGEDQLSDANDNGWWDPIGTYDSIVYTDASGIVNVSFTGQSTVARAVSVRATIRDGVLTGFDKTYLYFEPYSSASGNLGMTTDDTQLIADGASTTTVEIEVRDSDGNPAPAGTVVHLVAGEKFQDNNANGVFDASVDDLLIDANNNGLWDSYGSIPVTVTTNASGIASATYTTGTDVWDVYILAQVIDPVISASRSIMLSMSASVDLHTIFLWADVMHLSVIHTGGMQTANLHAVGYDAEGHPVPAGYPVTFTIVASPGGGEHLYNNANTGDPYIAMTDESGMATVPLTSGTISGTIKVRANWNTTMSEASQILVSAGPPKYITVAADTCNVPYWAVVNEEQAIIAIVSDTFYNPVNDSVMVYFSADEGTMKSHEVRTTDLEGRATSKWISNPIPETADGQVWIYAETDGGTVRDSSFFWNTWAPAVLTVNGLAASVPADGKSKLYFTITAVDLNGHPVIEGTKYTVKADPLSGADGTFQDGCAIAWDEGEIVSVILDEDLSMPGPTDDGIGAVVTISFRSGFATTSTHVVNVTTGSSYTKASNIDCQSTAGWGESVAITVTIKDYYNNPLGDHTLNLTASAGSVSGATQTTNSHGEAGTFFWTAPNADLTATIMITDTDPRGGSLVLTKQITVSAN